MKHAGGRPCQPEPYAWMMRFGVVLTSPRRLLTSRLCWQFCQCRSDEARRLILGVSLKNRTKQPLPLGER